jgi:FtsP/CotA-like multicopper oxidase with cupredoxin domain
MCWSVHARGVPIVDWIALVLATTVLAACGSQAHSPSESGDLTQSKAIDLNPAADIVEVKLVAEPTRIRYLSDGEADVWAYRDAGQTEAKASIPGPLIEAKQGDRVIVHLENRLPETTTVHWHGVRVPNMSDGTPTTQMEVAGNGGTFTYQFTASDAGTFWYHPHVRADIQIERGLYGMLVVSGGPDVPVDADRAFVLDDVKLEASGRLSDKTEPLDIMLGRRGNVLLVNGRTGATLTTKNGSRERWRFVNAANGRYFNLRLVGHTFLVVGWDGGLLPRPYETDTLLISPGERYEVLVRLEGAVGSSLALETVHHDRGHQLPDPGPKSLLTISFAGEAAPLAPLPSSWGQMAPVETSSATPIRQIVLKEIEGKTQAEDPKFLINDKAFPEVPPIDGRAAEVAVWTVKNDTEMDHPFHLHGMFFQILDVDGRMPEHLGWKDTVNVPQKQTLRFAVRYGDPGRWMYHCHILEHAERGMMAELMLAPSN